MSQNVTIGGFNFDKSYSPSVTIAYEYFKTPSGEIIGGHQIATVKGVVTVGGDGNTGGIVMSKLADIRDLGKQTKCVPISIPGVASDEGKVTSVNIEQGPDPAWINQGSFSIEVRAPLETIPANSFNITAQDGVTDISRSESLQIGEESHGFVYTSGGLSKAYAKFNNSLTLTCQPLCGSASGSTTFAVLNKVVKAGITQSIYSQYNSWIPFMQDRSLDIKSNGEVSFSADMILLPPGNSAGALVDINFGHSRDYNSKTITKTISGTINGLAPVSWSIVASLGDTFSASKLSNALGVFSLIRSRYANLSSWQGSVLSLMEKPNCPPPDTDGQENTCKLDDEEDEEEDLCIEPSTSTVTISRTEGTINFNFEWSNLNDEGQCIKNGVKKEITIEIIEPQSQFAEHVLPGQGTLIQDLLCKNAKRVNATVNITVPQDECNKYVDCPIDDDVQDEIDSYLTDGTYLRIEHTKSVSQGSVSIRQNYIKCE